MAIRGFKKLKNNPVQDAGENCAKCGLHAQCNSPKMPVSGEGRLGILIVAEAPGKTEDQRGIQLIGDAGQFLRGALKEHGLDLDKDFWKTNSIICRPENNRTPTKKEISLCRGNLTSTIERLKPKAVWLMGKVAVDSYFLDHSFSIDNIAAWRGRAIPDVENNCMVFPMFHPSYLIRNDRDENLKFVFNNDLKHAVHHSNEVPNKLKFPKIEYLFDPEEIAEATNDILNHKVVAFDFETSGIKPYRPKHRIYTIAMASPERVIAFPYMYPKMQGQYPKKLSQTYHGKDYKVIQKAFKKFLLSKKVKKVCHNLGYEFLWSYVMFGAEIQNAVACTMVFQHILDNTPKTTRLKFQSFVRWGVKDYDTEAKKFISGSGDKNNMHSMKLESMLKYNAYDAFLTLKLHEEQTQEFAQNSEKERASHLFLAGVLALTRASIQGICMDEKFMQEFEESLTKELDEIEKKIAAHKDVKKFKSVFRREFKHTSNADLRDMLQSIIQIRNTKETATGNFSVDHETLINNSSQSSLIQLIMEHRKRDKVRGTYLAQFKRETYEGKMHPFFNLHIARTFRSSSSRPNFQNIPVRDEGAKEVRKAIIPSPGNKIVEFDYGALEVRIIASYTKDPVLIEKIDDPHRDWAEELFLIKYDPSIKAHKNMRFHAKNGWVFPEFYGSWYVACAKNLWEVADEMNADDEGTPLKAHLRRNGIASYEVWEAHCKKCEEKFWGMFKVVKKWQEERYKKYLQIGHTESFFGFQAGGHMKRNDLVNYPIQGTAFHCLLWSFVRLDEIMREEKWNSRLIGQIHDSIIIDLDPAEEEHVLSTVKRVMSDELMREHDWIEVPMLIEPDITEVDQSWYYKKGIEI